MQSIIEKYLPYLSRAAIVAAVLTFTPASADRGHMQHDSTRQVIEIAHGIKAVQPYLPNVKYFEYALGIYRASSRYQIKPSLLIAIAQQESGFREGLREGRAGEIGICQILKSWLKNDRFRQEFPGVRLTDLKKPSKSFLYAAWILKTLQAESAYSAIPYWSYYNSTRFSNRLKYYVAVNKRLAQIKQKVPNVYHAQPPEQQLALAQVRSVAGSTSSADEMARALLAPKVASFGIPSTLTD